MSQNTSPRRLYEPADPTAVPGHAVRSAWIVPAGWMTVREHATESGNPTGDVSRLAQHGRLAMAFLRSIGVTTLPQVMERADDGAVYAVNVYPRELLDRTVWQIHARTVR